MEQFIVELYRAGGLLFVFAGGLCAILYFMMKHFLKQNDKILDALVIHQQKFADMNLGWQKVLDAHNANAIEYHARAAEADRFQRDEHKEIYAKLTFMQETFKAEHSNRALENQKVVSKLDEICKVVEGCEKK